jgi:hypothetical protein
MDKLEHFVLIAAVALVVGGLLLGWRDRLRVDLSDQLAAVLVMFVGVLVATLIEVVEFVSDWALRTTLQPSNLDTMTDLLAGDLGAIFGAVLATAIYCRWLTSSQRERLGRAGQWLSDGPSRVLDRHGFAITLAVSGMLALAVAVLWFAGRPVPGFPNG